MSEGTLEAGEQQQDLFDTEAAQSLLDQLLTDQRQPFVLEVAAPGAVTASASICVTGEWGSGSAPLTVHKAGQRSEFT